MEYLKLIVLGNSLQNYLVAAAVFFACIIVLKIFKTVFIFRLKKISEKTENKLDNVLIKGVNTIHWPFFVFTSFYAAISFLAINSKLEKVFYYIFLIAFVYYAIRFFNNLLEFGIKAYAAKNENEETAVVKFIGAMIKIILWIGAVLLILSNMGVNVTSLLAGMGIGGIAIALALQNVLGDLFSSLSIYFDKPFKVGDHVSLGAAGEGNVKKIGLKTTRIETLQGEELVVANSELTKAQLSNFGAMKRRRVVFDIGVTYDTPYQKLKKISGYIREAIESHGEMTEVSRIHFMRFGDFSLVFTAVFYINSGDYNDYADIQENINFKILEKLEENKIEIAFPTQTLYVKK